MNAYALIDLDNVAHWEGPSFGMSADLLELIVQVLAHIEQEAGVSIQAGVAAMNEVTHKRVPTSVSKMLEQRHIAVRTVPALREEADKVLFFEAGLAVSAGFQSFIVVSNDTGFARTADCIRTELPDADVVGVTSKGNGRLQAAYQATGARVLTLQKRSSQAKRPETRRERRALYIATCLTCGMKARAERDVTICQHCGGVLHTAPFGDRILPPGRVPFVDGSILQIWYRGQLRRTVVLTTQSTTFGRDISAAQHYGFVELGDIVEAPSRVSHKQFVVTLNGTGTPVLRNTGRRPMFHEQPGGKYCHITDDAVALQHGDTFWLNTPNEARHSTSVLRFVFLDHPE